MGRLIEDTKVVSTTSLETEANPYKVAWNDIKTYLEQSKSHLLDVRNCGGISSREKARIDIELETLRLVLNQMHNMEPEPHAKEPV